jgi:hypothetical protein
MKEAANGADNESAGRRLWRRRRPTQVALNHHKKARPGADVMRAKAAFYAIGRVQGVIDIVGIKCDDRFMFWRPQ